MALPVAWDYVTSGLEHSLALLWLSSAWAVVAGRVCGRPSGRAAPGAALLAGLGPLVRPEAALYSAAFGAALLARAGGARAGARVVSLLVAPLALAEVARMAYFGVLTPNSAIAKEVVTLRIDAGTDYLVDFARTYVLAVPLALAALVYTSLRARVNATDGDGEAAHRARRLLCFGIPAGALVHVLYLVAIGGDFMHGRLLLLPLFALLLPVWVVPAERRAAVSVAVIGVWAVACGAALRVPYENGIARSTGIADERGFYVTLAGARHPVTVEQFGPWTSLPPVRLDGETVVVESLPPREVARLVPDGSPQLVVRARAIGALGYSLPLDVYLEDVHGLASVLGSHMRLEERGRPGHEKEVAEAWTLARFGALGDDAPAALAREVDAARAALGCGRLDELQRSVSGRLTLGRLLRNVGGALGRQAFRFDPDPRRAERELCDG